MSWIWVFSCIVITKNAIHNRARERKSAYGNDHRDVMVRRKWGFMMERSLLEFVLVHLYLRPAWGRGEGGKNA